MKTLTKYFLNTKAYTLYALALVVSILYGIIVSPFFLHFIDGLTYVGVIYLLVGVVTWEKDSGINIANNYKDSKEAKEHTRKDAEISLYIPIGILIILISTLLALVY